MSDDDFTQPGPDLERVLFFFKTRGVPRNVSVQL